MANVRYPGTAGTTPETITAADVTYDNTTSGLTADDVQEALDEIDGNVDTLSGKVYKTDDSTETTIASDDLLPIYDTSATASKKITVANVVKATVSNPNLIDNPWFTVNQRGFSSDITLGYTVDRWKNNIGNFTVSISDDIITLTKSSDTTISEFIQYFELSRLSACVGKYITLSVMLSDGTIYKGSGIMPTLTSSLQWFIDFSIGDDFTAGCGVRSTSNCLIRIKSDIASATLSVKAVKLEVGSISTLALDTAPNYATELLKCQRYFVRFGYPRNTNYEPLGAGFIKNANRACIYIKMPTEMKASPAITQEGKIYVQTPTLGPADAPSVFENVSAKGKQAMILYLKPDTSDQFTVGVSAAAHFNQTSSGTPQSHIDFSADL